MDEAVQLIDQILKAKLEASHVDIIDESYLHRGHKAAGGGGALRGHRRFLEV